MNFWMLLSSVEYRYLSEMFSIEFQRFHREGDITGTSRNSNDFSNGDEETDCDEISRPSPSPSPSQSPPPPKRRNKRSQERTSDSPESLSPKTESTSCRTHYSFIFSLSCQQRTLLEQVFYRKVAFTSGLRLKTSHSNIDTMITQRTTSASKSSSPLSIKP
ncbi:hypothetical protein F0562_019018 [Nyssa sinensis]|uniref:Uncharacterized protein n=1 Tax=Nyssa sinensis TaxID=561372 RepID=A0A5J4ZDL2_9ASTE|nr:hypothetical protein F0562_019018 [Nyssa sinensis]